jgi:DNA-binding LacI/PurR family transcriptional regulator
MPATTYTFRKIADELEAQIALGRFRPGEAIPPISQLCGTYDVAPMTVRRAVSQLCASGRLVTRPGKGTFVAASCPLEGVVLVTNFQIEHDRVWMAQRDALVGAQEACNAAKIPIIAVPSHESLSKYTHRSYGFLLVPAGPQDKDLARWVDALSRARLPFVCAGVDNGWDNYLYPDGVAASRLALEHLYGLGHRRVLLMPRIGMTGRPRFSPVSLKNAPDLQVDFYPYATDRGAKATAAQVARVLDDALARADRPTGLFIGPDEPVHMALDHLRERGMRVPKALSLVGYCRRAYAEWNGVRITRVDNPHRKVVFRAVQELIRMGAGGGYAPGRMAIEPDFFDGETCAPVPAQVAAVG